MGHRSSKKRTKPPMVLQPWEIRYRANAVRQMQEYGLDPDLVEQVMQFAIPSIETIIYEITMGRSPAVILKKYKPFFVDRENPNDDF